VRLETTAKAQYTAGHATQVEPPSPRISTADFAAPCLSLSVCTHPKERCLRCGHSACSVSGLESPGLCVPCAVAPVRRAHGAAPVVDRGEWGRVELLSARPARRAR
jgi:hypothetical protein